MEIMIKRRHLQALLKKKRFLVLLIVVIVIYNIYLLYTKESDGPILRYLEHKKSYAYEEAEGAFNELPGQLNVHIWEDVCDCRLENFRRYLAFPPRKMQNPDTRTTVEGFFQISWGQTGYAQRIFGFIHPPVTGKYKFAISADDEAELYLSSDEKPEKISQIANVTVPHEGNCADFGTISGNYKSFPSQISSDYTLKNGKKYFIEVLHKQGPRSDNVEVAWLIPGKQEFELIGEDFFSCFANETKLKTPFEYEYKIANYDPFNYEHQHHHKIYETPMESIDFLKMKFANAEDFKDVLPNCEYTPTYLVPRGLFLQRYEAYYHHVYHTAHYPNWHEEWQFIQGGSKVSIKKSKAEKVVKRFLYNVALKHPGKYTLVKIVNVEMKADRHKGNRYFIELILNVKDVKEQRRFSEYIFELDNNHSLCYPNGLQWNKTATVNILATVKNQGHWVRHLIENLKDIMLNTGERNFHLIVFDYNSDDYDLADILYKSNLPSYTFISQPGMYSRAESFNAAAKAVTDPNSIVFACDLHLDMPRNLFDMLRKHTIINRLVYGPMIIRLACGATPEKPSGFWEWAGFGIIALTKADWDLIGGYNEEEFKHKWGGEDWEMLDRVAKHRLDIERLMFPNFYHYFHTRKKLWGNDGKRKAKQLLPPTPTEQLIR